MDSMITTPSVFSCLASPFDSRDFLYDDPSILQDNIATLGVLGTVSWRTIHIEADVESRG